MELLIGYVTRMHETNLPLYALVTVFSMAVTGVTVGSLATGLINVLGAPSGQVKGGA